ncbi:MAG: PAS domain S-box protein [Jatrophihabitantaceae bacterium]
MDTRDDVGKPVHPSVTALPVDTPATVQAIETLGLAGSHPIVRCFPQGALIVFDRDLRFLIAGGLGLADVGLTRSMLEGNTIFEAFPPETVAVIEPKFRLALDGFETAIDVPYRNHIYLMRLAPLRDADGEIVAGLGCTQDVTEARRAEVQLRESEERVRLVFDHSPIGNALIDLTGRYLEVNQAMCDITGYSAGQLLELSIADTTHPDDLPADLAASRELLAGNVLQTAVDKRFLTPSGGTVWVTKSSSLLRHDDGAPRHFIAQVQDITARKNYELALAEERSRLREAELIARMGSWDLDVDTGEIRWSDALFALRGLDHDTFEGNLAGATRWVHPDDRERVRTAISQCSRTGEPMLVRYRATRVSDGALCWFDARGKAVYEGTRLVRVAGTSSTSPTTSPPRRRPLPSTPSGRRSSAHRRTSSSSMIFQPARRYGRTGRSLRRSATPAVATRTTNRKRTQQP